MEVFIPTFKRVNRQLTWDKIDPRLREHVTLVVHPEEAEQHLEAGRNILISPDQGKGMAAIRGWIVRYAQAMGMDHILIMDDDLTMQVAKHGKIVNSNYQEQKAAFGWMDRALNEVPLAAFGVRFLDYDNGDDHTECCRGMQAIGLDTKWAKGYGVNFDNDVPEWMPMDDFNITLQTLTRGFRNRVSLKYRTCPASANAPGGCSEQRTLQRQNEAARLIAKLYPQYVRVREKKAWRGMDGVMYDVTVAWKRAYNENKDKQP